MIEAHDLHKSFGTVQALKGVSFNVQDGQITGLLGPNGAGKTTTLRILYGIIQPDGGTARVDHFDVSKQTLQAQQCIGALPDAHGIYPRLTARENIRYYGELRGLSGDSLETQILSLVDLLDMHDFIDRRTEGFSTGQRLKVAIARSLIHNPHNVLLDEPTNGLDVMSTRSIRDLIRKLRDEGRCVLFSSHIMQEVAALCDHIVVISNGKVVASGTTEQLKEITGKTDLEDAYVAVTGRQEEQVEA